MKKLTTRIGKQAGIGLVQIALALMVVGASTSLAIQRYNETQSEAMNTAAFEEVSRWLSEMANIGVVSQHDYTGLTETSLIDQTSIANATNVFGQPIVLVESTGDWQMTYPFNSIAACNYVRVRVLDYPGLNATAPICSGVDSDELVIEVE